MNTLYDDLRAALYSIWHRRWLALGIAWAICLAGWLGVALIPNTYQSHAKILIQLYDPLAAQVGIGEADRKRDVDHVRDTLTSADHLQQIISSTRLGEGISTPKQMESAVAALDKMIKVTSVQDNMVEIDVSSNSMRFSDADNARLCRDIVQKLIDIFRTEAQATNVGELNQTLSFLDQQIASRQQELNAADQRRLAFESQHPELAEGGVSMVQRLESDRAQIRGFDSDLIAAQSSLASLNGQMASTPRTIAGGVAAGGARGELAQAQADLAAMHARGMTDNHPDVIAQRNQIAALKTQVQAEGSAGLAGGMPNPAYSSLESIRSDRQANIQSIEARRAAVQQDIAQVTAQQMADPALVEQAQNISRDYDVLKQQYDKMLSDRADLRLRGQVQNEPNSMKIQLLDPPQVPRSPAAPNRPVLLSLVLAAGLALGLGVAFAVGEMRSTFATTAKLERAFDLPVLGAISQSRSAAGQAERTRKVRRFFVAAGGLGALFVLLLVMEFVPAGVVS